MNDPSAFAPMFLWTAESEGGAYSLHRIPGIIITARGTLLAWCEARSRVSKNSLEASGDWSHTDILLRRSTDGGKTFSPSVVLAEGSEEAETVNNPVMMEDRNGAIHLLYCRNYTLNGGGIWQRLSYDDGLTWTSAREITQFADSVPHDCLALGPTHGICTATGRLAVAVWLVRPGEGECITSHIPNQTHLFYSDDDGETWNLSLRASEASDETSVAELENGDILLNSRATPCRKLTVCHSDLSFSETVEAPDLPDPGCCGGSAVFQDPLNGKCGILFANCADTAARERVTVSASYDGGATWIPVARITEHSGGYCDIAADATTAYLLYEENWGREVYLVRLPLSEICHEHPHQISKERIQL